MPPLLSWTKPIPKYFGSISSTCLSGCELQMSPGTVRHLCRPLSTESTNPAEAALLFKPTHTRWAAGWGSVECKSCSEKRLRLQFAVAFCQTLPSHPCLPAAILRPAGPVWARQLSELSRPVGPVWSGVCPPYCVLSRPPAYPDPAAAHPPPCRETHRTGPPMPTTVAAWQLLPPAWESAANR